MHTATCSALVRPNLLSCLSNSPNPQIALVASVALDRIRQRLQAPQSMPRSVNPQWGGEGGMVHCMWTGHAFLSHHDRADSPTSLANISLSSLHFAPISQHSPARRPRGPGCGRGAAVKRRQANKSTPCSVGLIWSRETSTDLPCPLAKAHYLLPLSHISPQILSQCSNFAHDWHHHGPARGVCLCSLDA